jgi:hypothetical protein
MADDSRAVRLAGSTIYCAFLLMDILRTQPYAIVGGMLQVNSFYVPPDNFCRSWTDGAPRQIEG